VKSLPRSLLLALALTTGAWVPVEAQTFEQSLAAAQRGDYRMAFAGFKKLAEQGDADAQLKLGIMYQLGRGVPTDEQQAAAWYRKAAEQGDPMAQFYLGDIYRNGQGVPADHRAGAAWQQRRADAGLGRQPDGRDGIQAGRDQAGQDHRRHSAKRQLRDSRQRAALVPGRQQRGLRQRQRRQAACAHGDCRKGQGLYRAGGVLEVSLPIKQRRVQDAIPRKTASERLTASIKASSALPKGEPILSSLIVIALSTMTWERLLKPLPLLGSTVTRNNGALTSSLDTGSTVTLAWA
jgi:hypothetical protein